MAVPAQVDGMRVPQRDAGGVAAELAGGPQPAGTEAERITVAEAERDRPGTGRGDGCCLLPPAARAAPRAGSGSALHVAAASSALIWRCRFSTQLL